jgi:RNA polymerase sigma factor (sigma-70 family)
MPFAPRSEHDLVRLDDDALLTHLREARRVGDGEQAVLAVRVLVFGHWDRVTRRVALKVAPEDVQPLASDVIYSAIRSAFDGESVGEFVTWLNTITNRRIADHHRRRENVPAVVSIGVGNTDGAGGHIEPADVSQDGLVETRDAVERTLASLSEQHARVVERHVIEGVPAREVGAELGVGADNVAQISSRFRRRLREQLTTSEDR